MQMTFLIILQLRFFITCEKNTLPLLPSSDLRKNNLTPEGFSILFPDLQVSYGE